MTSFHKTLSTLFPIFLCFTHSAGILFESKGDVEDATGKMVVEGCKENPFTVKKECDANLRCFPQSIEIKKGDENDPEK